MALAFVALGANLPSPRFGPPQATLQAALAALADRIGPLAARSRWFESEPVPKSDQPWFINGVAALETSLKPLNILKILHDIEREFGRVRKTRWEARLLDLDLLAVDGQILPDRDSWASAPANAFRLPHPRLHERRFVLLPLLDVAPDWRHPVTGEGVGEMLAKLLAKLPESEVVRPLQG
ncbi:MAG: 2-amino-4-hydroxy-6-hydroxymethyldihydropteridine diphosphokinase [Proteobacteria bacterium]|nr:MAG: 2-amino-4-hydroxy-6-hydroxymethyldihydropteridine diphosphokinase [Pseudomonadota bacterium]